MPLDRFGDRLEEGDVRQPAPVDPEFAGFSEEEE
jgi:hypothetical protein